MPATPILASQQVNTAAQPVKQILGWSFAELAGAAARIRVYDGANTNGILIASLNLAANESVRDWLLPEALPLSSGSLYVQVVSGSVEGSVWWA